MAERRQTMTHICNKETDIALIKQRQEQQQQMLTEIHKAIVGNGHPGLKQDVEIMKITINEVKIKTENNDKKIINNDKRMAYYAGVIAVVVFIVTIAVNKFIKL